MRFRSYNKQGEIMVGFQISCCVHVHDGDDDVDDDNDYDATNVRSNSMAPWNWFQPPIPQHRETNSTMYVELVRETNSTAL